MLELLVFLARNRFLELFFDPHRFVTSSMSASGGLLQARRSEAAFEPP